MATYAIGDIQGSRRTLEALLRRLRFDARGDRVWLVGDLVNRGPDSLGVLRWARSLGDRHVVVLGNHDLHLLARAGGTAGPRRWDTLDALLTAPDRDDLLAWLRERPLFHREGGFALVHAGLVPSWTLNDAERHARAAETVVGAPDGPVRMGAGRGKGERLCWHEELSGDERVRVLVAVFTRLRTCTEEGVLCLEYSGPPEGAPPPCRPWFEHPHRRGDAHVIFGHWSALGLRRGEGFTSLDTGCVWGGSLTAYRLDDGEVFAEPYQG